MFWNVTLHSLSYLTDRDFYFEKRLDGSAHGVRSCTEIANTEREHEEDGSRS